MECFLDCFRAFFTLCAWLRDYYLFDFWNNCLRGIFYICILIIYKKIAIIYFYILSRCVFGELSHIVNGCRLFVLKIIVEARIIQISCASRLWNFIKIVCVAVR